MFQMPCKYTTINLKAVTPVYGYLQLSYRNSGSFSKTFPFYGSFASSCLIMTLETYKQRAISAVPFTKLCGAEPCPVLLLDSQASDVTYLRSVPSGYVQRHVEHWWVKNSTKNDQKRQHPVKNTCMTFLEQVLLRVAMVSVGCYFANGKKHWGFLIGLHIVSGALLNRSLPLKWILRLIQWYHLNWLKILVI